jgi:hypothetical protein
MGLPARTKEALLALSQKQYTAVLEYLDRGSPAFGNKSVALKMAGYAKGTRGADVFGTEAVQLALTALREEAIAISQHVIEDIKALSPEAKDELMAQLRLGGGMEPIDPTDVFGENLEEAGEMDDARLKAINTHNRNLAQFAKERREAARDILAYAEGTPEQRVRVTREAGATELEKMLSSMSREDFERLGKALFGETKKGSDHEEIPVAEAEIVEE